MASNAIPAEFFISVPVRAEVPVNGPPMPMLMVSVAATVLAPGVAPPGAVVVPAPPVHAVAMIATAAAKPASRFVDVRITVSSFCGRGESPSTRHPASSAPHAASLPVVQGGLDALPVTPLSEDLHVHARAGLGEGGRQVGEADGAIDRVP